MKKTISTIMAIFLIASSSTSFGKDNNEKDPLYGGIEFERSCSVCHGFQGRGNGVMADSLKVKPTDLTKLSKENNGHFPFIRVYRVIEGSPRVGVHGTREMPVWGDRYRQEAEEYSADDYIYTRGLILELVTYIISIQEE